MNFRTRIRLAIRDFFKDYGKIILIIFVVWLAIFLVNQYLLSLPKQVNLLKTYDLSTPIMDDTKKVSSNNQEKINETVRTYFNYCNTKDYENAYNMLTDACKNYVYHNNIENFKLYIDSIYKNNKTYYTQNYSNVNNAFVYILTILDDIEASGTTGGFTTYEERIALIKENNSFKISCDNYVDNKKIDVQGEDNYLEVDVISKDISYTKESYNLKITNKTNNYIVIANLDIPDEVQLNLGDQYRSATNLDENIYYLKPNETSEMNFMFVKYLDDEKTPEEIRFNSVRVLENINTNTGENNSKLYSFNIKLK